MARNTRTYLITGALSMMLSLPVTCFSQNPGPPSSKANQPSSSTANQPGTNQTAQKPNLKEMESMLVSRIHMVNQMEIKAGKLAAQKGGSFTVREYGQRLQMDHTIADRKILAYANAHNLQVMSPQDMVSKMKQMPGPVPEPQIKPQQMEAQGSAAQSSTPPDQQMQQQMSNVQATMQKLQGLNDQAFDDAFTQFMVQSHTHAIARLSMMQQMLPQNSGLRSLLGNMVPVLEQHYDIASRLQLATLREHNRELGNRMSAQMQKGGQ